MPTISMASRPEWNVITRKGSSQWADSVLPPSPRTAFTQEVGHVGSFKRQPKVNTKNVRKPPPSYVQPSDKQLSPRGWMFERVSVLGLPSPQQQRQQQGLSEEELTNLRRRELKIRARLRLAAINARRERDWDPTQFTYMPSTLRGMKPVTQEPWTRDAVIYARKTGSFEKVANAEMDGTAVEEFNDESVLDATNGYQTQVTATGLLKPPTALSKGPTWDTSPFRPCPHTLRGIKPVTREPWVHDERVYNRDTTRDTTDDERAGGGALELGSISHATRAKARQVDRPGFYFPNWEKWSAGLSA